MQSCHVISSFLANQISKYLVRVSEVHQKLSSNTGVKYQGKTVQKSFKTRPQSQIYDQKTNSKSNGVKPDHDCNELRGYLGKGIQVGLWRETSFNSQKD